MREIKFNYVFQHDETGRICTITFDYADIFNGECRLQCSRLTGYAVVTKRQYTGLKDKNGKEIYEGDIIQTSYGKVGDVAYYERSASFIVNDPNHFNEQLWHDAVNSEIIGNIYENAELVK